MRIKESRVKTNNQRREKLVIKYVKRNGAHTAGIRALSAGLHGCDGEAKTSHSVRSTTGFRTDGLPLPHQAIHQVDLSFK